MNMNISMNTSDNNDNNDNNGDLLSLLECDLCFSLVCEPISLGCGHTYCRLCIYSALSRSKKQCPSCRAVCHLNVETAPENIMIKNLALKLNPDLYKKRAEESAAELAEHKDSNYPVFFYMECLFPGTRLQLHLFEPRYKLMMQRIVNASRTFAYAPYPEQQCREGNIVLIFHLEECEFLPDGRCLIDGKIKSRAKIVNHFVEDGTQRLHYCNAVIFNDEPVNESDKDKVQEFITIGRFLANQLLESASPDGFTLRQKIEHKYGPAPASNDELFSLWLTAICPLPDIQKKALLSSTSTLNRLETSVGVMINLMQHVNIGGLATSHTATAVEAQGRNMAAQMFAASGMAAHMMRNDNFLAAILGHDVDFEGEDEDEDEDDYEDEDDDEEEEDSDTENYELPVLVPIDSSDEEQ